MFITIERLFALFVALALFGFGCGNKSPAPAQEPSRADAGAPAEPTPDAGDRVPEGWQWYESKEGGYKIAYPPSWRVTDDGTLYKDAPNLEQLLAESQGHFESIAQVAPASIGVVAFDPEGKTVDQLWEEARDDSEIDQEIVVSGERGRIAKCGGIRYGECIYMIRGGTAYSISMIDQGLVNSDDPVLQKEIEQIISTFNFLP